MAKRVMLFTLSTCGWCKRLKEFLESHGVEFEDRMVDRLEPGEKQRAREDLARWNPRKSYPTTVIDEKEVVTGFDDERLKEILGLCPTTKPES